MLSFLQVGVGSDESGGGLLTMETILPPGEGGGLHLRTGVAAMRGPHRYAELELNLVTAGSAAYLLGPRRYLLRPRTLVWLFPAQEHFLLSQAAGLEMWLGVFSHELVMQCCPATPLLQAADPAGHFCRVLSEEAAGRLETVFALCEAGAGDRRRAGLGFALLSAWEAFGQADEAPSGTDVHPGVERAARLIRDETEALSLGSLAEGAGLSPTYLSGLFKAQTGLSLTQFRARQRVERWVRLYGRGRRMSMLAAALEAGFGSYPQFYRVFRETMGCGPAEYRRKMDRDA